MFQKEQDNKNQENIPHRLTAELSEVMEILNEGIGKDSEKQTQEKHIHFGTVAINSN